MNLLLTGGTDLKFMPVEKSESVLANVLDNLAALRNDVLRARAHGRAHQARPRQRRLLTRPFRESLESVRRTTRSRPFLTTGKCSKPHMSEAEVVSQRAYSLYRHT